MRPAEEELEEGVEEFMVLWNYLSNLPSYSRLENGSETSELRRFSFERKPGEGHVLFRPIGQIAFAEALGILIYKKEFSLKEVFHKLNKYDVDGGLSGIEFPDSIWYGVLYDFNRKRMSVAGRDLAMRLFIYILGGVSDKMERAEVRRQLAQARRVGEDQAVDFQGKFVELKKVGLPEILY